MMDGFSGCEVATVEEPFPAFTFARRRDPVMGTWRKDGMESVGDEIFFWI